MMLSKIDSFPVIPNFVQIAVRQIVQLTGYILEVLTPKHL